MSRQRFVLLYVPTLAICWCAAWWYQPGTFSYHNYNRIEMGMELMDVQKLLGSPGEEMSFNHIPGDGWRGVVWGEQCYRWKEYHRHLGGERTIHVGVVGGRVVSKHLFEFEL